MPDVNHGRPDDVGQALDQQGAHPLSGAVGGPTPRTGACRSPAPSVHLVFTTGNTAPSGASLLLVGDLTERAHDGALTRRRPASVHRDVAALLALHLLTQPPFVTPASTPAGALVVFWPIRIGRGGIRRRSARAWKLFCEASDASCAEQISVLMAAIAACPRRGTHLGPHRLAGDPRPVTTRLPKPGRPPWSP